MNSNLTDPIVAIATPTGQGAIGVIRLSGHNCIDILDKYFHGKNLTKVEGNTIHYGKIKDENGRMIDECLVSVFKAPRSYTKEDSVEISCHGSEFILKSVVQLLIRNQVRQANPGEFTMRAFLNGQLDLSQAEAVADLISSESSSQHEIALHQMRGGFSSMISNLREELISFASLIELENDFGEEDVEFADRTSLIALVHKVIAVIKELKASFEYGNAIKEGIPVAIVGAPNVGKSTLLNILLNEEKAIVSAIAGTTRDVIEDTMNIEGVLFRFLDTAGIRDTQDEIESIGIQRSLEQIEKASIVLYLAELKNDHQKIVDEFKAINLSPDKKALILLTKSDLYGHSCHSYDIEEAVSTLTNRTPTLTISASDNKNIDTLKSKLIALIDASKPQNQQVVVSNIRHYESLHQTETSLQSVITGLDQKIPSDLIAMDIRHALNYLGEISGEISTDDLLESIFSNFCIGK